MSDASENVEAEVENVEVEKPMTVKEEKKTAAPAEPVVNEASGPGPAPVNAAAELAPTAIAQFELKGVFTTADEINGAVPMFVKLIKKIQKKTGAQFVFNVKIMNGQNYQIIITNRKKPDGTYEYHVVPM